MTKRLLLGVLLAVVAPFLTACELEEEAEDSEETLGQERGASATPEPSPAARAPQLAPLGCPDCRVKAGDELEVTLADIRVGADGKYYALDRGDGCAYRETGRVGPMAVGELKIEEQVMLWAEGCEAGWSFEPATGRVNPVIP